MWVQPMRASRREEAGIGCADPIRRPTLKLQLAIGIIIGSNIPFPSFMNPHPWPQAPSEARVSTPSIVVAFDQLFIV